MGITLHGTPTTQVNANSNNLSVALPSGVADGDLVIALFAIGTNGRTLTPPSGYSQAPNCFVNTNAPSAGVYYHVWHTGDPTSVTFSYSGSNFLLHAVAICAAYSGADTSNPIEASKGQQDSATTTPATPSISTFGSADMLLMLYVAIGGAITGWSSASEGTIEASTHQNSALSADAAFVDLLLSSSGATGSQNITTQSATFSAFQVAIKPPPKTFNQTLSASAAGSASIVKSAGKILSASAAGSASIIKSVSKILSASAAGAASIVKSVGKALSASSAGVASFTKTIGKTLGAVAQAIANLIGVKVGPPVAVSPVVIHAPVLAAAAIVAPMVETCVIHAPVVANCVIVAKVK